MGRHENAGPGTRTAQAWEGPMPHRGKLDPHRSTALDPRELRGPRPLLRQEPRLRRRRLLREAGGAARSGSTRGKVEPRCSGSCTLSYSERLSGDPSDLEIGCVWEWSGEPLPDPLGSETSSIVACRTPERPTRRSGGRNWPSSLLRSRTGFASRVSSVRHCSAIRGASPNGWRHVPRRRADNCGTCCSTSSSPTISNAFSRRRTRWRSPRPSTTRWRGWRGSTTRTA